MDLEEPESKRSSIVRTSSASAIISLNLPPSSPLLPAPHNPVPHSSSPAPPEMVSKVISDVHKVREDLQDLLKMHQAVRILCRTEDD